MSLVFYNNIKSTGNIAGNFKWENIKWQKACFFYKIKHYKFNFNRLTAESILSWIVFMECNGVSGFSIGDTLPFAVLKFIAP
jgi:hypothetical protein